MCVTTGLLTTLTAARSAQGEKLISRLSLFAPLLFSVSCSNAQPPWSPVQGHFPAGWPFQPLPFVSPLEPEEDVLCRMERMCSLQKENNPMSVCISVIASSQVLLCEIFRVTCLDGAH